MQPIITSFLDQDFYKFSMAQVVWQKFPSAQVVYAYKCRNEANLSPLADQIQEQINLLGELRFSKDELNYLSSIRYLHPEFINFLKRFYLDPTQVRIKKDPFEIEIHGSWGDTIFWEIFLLSIISELYYKSLPTPVTDTDMQKADEALTGKIAMVQNFAIEKLDFRLIEFGTRRRFSAAWQEHVLIRLKNEIPNQLFGTSNVLLAKKHNLRPIGTMAHEYLQAFQALGPKLADSQKCALQTWADIYRGDLGIALTDVISMNAFLRDFDLYFAKLFDGLRHDSGDPFIWGEKSINHYNCLKIDPQTKALVFSDSLTMLKAINLCRTFEPRIRTSFGMGTHLTCDIPGLAALNHIIKMIYCNGQPVAKISDAPGKSMCRDEGYATYLKSVFNYPN